ncbi:MAG TPA: hypothetical protein VFW83_02440 [Bryobacteraceae bacterium]|nr:hypothetical protein [Bryobacteraceae bacterium]
MKTAAVVCGFLAMAAIPAWAARCENLAALKLPHMTLAPAQTVPAGQFAPPPTRPPGGNAVYKTLPEFCRVAATLRPTSDSEIKIEVWMPAANSWNRGLEAVGNGAWAGSIGYGAMARLYLRAMLPPARIQATPATAQLSPWGILRN